MYIMSKQAMEKKPPNILFLMSTEVCVHSVQQSPSEPKVDLNSGMMLFSHFPIIMS